MATALAAWTWLLAAGVVWGWVLSAPAAAARSAAEIEACVGRTLPDRGSAQRITLVVSDAEGEISRSQARVYWKRFEDEPVAAVLRFTAPPGRTGVAVRVRDRSKGGPDTYVYLPELRRTRRVPPFSESGSMLGTDFSYEDFAVLHGLRRAGPTQKLADAQVEGRPAYVLATQPEAGTSGYKRIVSYVDVDRCILLRTEFYADGGTFSKVFRVDVAAIKSYGELSIPMHVVMQDLDADTETDVQIESIDPDADLRDYQFHPLQLDKAGR